MSKSPLTKLPNIGPTFAEALKKSGITTPAEFLARDTKIKIGNYYYSFNVNSIPQCAILSQLRLYDAKRGVRKIGMISQTDFLALKQKIKSLL